MRFIDSSEDESEADRFLGMEKHPTERRFRRRPRPPALAPIHERPSKAVSMDCIKSNLSPEEEFKVMAANKLISAMENLRDAERRQLKASTESLPVVRKANKTRFLSQFLGRRDGKNLNAVVSSPVLISSTCTAVSLTDLTGVSKTGLNSKQGHLGPILTDISINRCF